MFFLLLVLFGAVLLLPALVLLLVFLTALFDYLRGGGPAATTTGCNADLRTHPTHPNPATGLLDI